MPRPLGTSTGVAAAGRGRRLRRSAAAPTMAAMTPDCLPPLLLQALRDAPRPYRMPPLPADAQAAREAGVDAALAFALEQARAADESGAAAPRAVRELFLWALAEVIRTALRAEGGDPAFQAQALRARTPEVEAYAALQAQAKADVRAVRTAVSAFAHPARVERLPPSATREALRPLHGLVQAGDWEALGRAAEFLKQCPPAEADWLEVRDARDTQDARDAPDAPSAPGAPGLAASLSALAELPALRRLRRAAELLRLESVQRYRALCGQRGPLAGSQAAAVTGRASARLGAAAETVTVQAFGEVAALLNRQPGEAGLYSVVQGLRTPGSFVGAVHGAKDEWDVALLRAAPGGDALDVVLLAEVKACAAAATTDLPRLRRGLRRLALAEEGGRYAFAGVGGEVWLSGRSLRRLQPPPAGLPPRALYCCTAPADAAPRWLDSAAKAVLLAEPASLAFAAALSDGADPDEQALAPAWDALATVPRLRTALGQFGLARDAREAMLHPRDLLTAVAARA